MRLYQFSCWFQSDCCSNLCIQTTHQHTSHTPSEKGGVCINVLTVDELLQLRNSLFSLCNSNGSQKLAFHSLLGTLSKLWTADGWVRCWCVMTCILWIPLDGMQLSYLAKTLHLSANIDSRWHPQSASSSMLVILSTGCTMLHEWAFPVAAAWEWIALSPSVCSVLSLLQFRCELKIALFQSSYSSPQCPAVWQTNF